MTEQEKTLLAGCVKGDKSSWDAFVQQYSNLVYQTIRKTLNLHRTDQRDEIVGDLYQDVFISLLADDGRKLKQFRGDAGCTLVSWVRMIAVRQPQWFDAMSDDPTDGLADAASTHQLADHLAKAVMELLAREKIFDRDVFSAQPFIGGVGRLGETPATKASPESNSNSSLPLVSTSHPYFWAPFILVGDGK